MRPGPPKILRDGDWVINPDMDVSSPGCMILTNDLTIDFSFILDGNAGASHKVCIVLDNNGERCFYLAGSGSRVAEHVQT